MGGTLRRVNLTHLRGMKNQEDDSVRGMGNVDMRGASSLGVLVPKGTIVDKCMGSFEQPTP